MKNQANRLRYTRDGNGGDCKACFWYDFIRSADFIKNTGQMGEWSGQVPNQEWCYKQPGNPEQAFWWVRDQERIYRYDWCAAKNRLLSLFIRNSYVYKLVYFCNWRILTGLFDGQGFEKDYTGMTVWCSANNWLLSLLITNSYVYKLVYFCNWRIVKGLFGE